MVANGNGGAPLPHGLQTPQRPQLSQPSFRHLLQEVLKVAGECCFLSGGGGQRSEPVSSSVFLSWLILSHDLWAPSCRCGLQLSSTQPAQKVKDKYRYQYGNHSCYYGYHGFYGDGWEGRVGAKDDPRLRLLEADWFRDKKVLDVGCGAGHVTLAIARRFDPTHILGVELDERLLHAAKKNIRHFLSHDMVAEERRGKRQGMPGPCFSVWGGGEEEEGMKEEEQQQHDEVKEQVQQALCLLSLPLSFRVSRGPLSAPPLLPPSSSSSFPNNVTFIQVSVVSFDAVMSCCHAAGVSAVTPPTG